MRNGRKTTTTNKEGEKEKQLWKSEHTSLFGSKENNILVALAGKFKQGGYNEQQIFTDVI